MNYKVLVKVLSFEEKSQLALLAALLQVKKYPQESVKSADGILDRYVTILDDIGFIILKKPLFGMFGTSKYVVTPKGNEALRRYYDNSSKIKVSMFDKIYKLKSILKGQIDGPSKVEPGIRDIIDGALKDYGFTVARYYLQEMVLAGVFDNTMLGVLVDKKDEVFLGSMLETYLKSRGYIFTCCLNSYHDRYFGDLKDFWYYVMFSELLYGGFYDSYFLEGNFGTKSGTMSGTKLDTVCL